MSQTINTNIASLIAQRNLNQSQSSLATSMQRLSSGMRINSAADDAAGLGIATRMDAQVRGMNVAIRNANDAISLTQTAEGALGSIGDALQRMRELAVQSANASNSGADKDSLNSEFNQLAREIQRIAGGTSFNGITVLGASAGGQAYQVGANTSGNDSITVTTSNIQTNVSIVSVAGNSVGAGIATIDSTQTLGQIDTVINNIDAAINTINTQRGLMGAAQSRFNEVISNLQTSVVNQSAAKSRIMDADFAAETANMSRASILQQAGNAMIAQANQQPQLVLKLLQ